jgi:hypothetical protein
VPASRAGRVSHSSEAQGPDTPVSDPVILKPYEKALAEAQRMLVHPEAYQVGDWHWGFKEVAGTVELEEMSLVYQFVFTPLATASRAAHPPQIVEVQGEDAL